MPLVKVNDLLRLLVEGHELWAGILASQFLSNVPAAILLSGFFRGLRDWIAVHLHHFALLSLRGTLFLRDWGWAAPS